MIRAGYETLEQWRAGKLRAIPAALRWHVSKVHQRRHGKARDAGGFEVYTPEQQAANRWLYGVADRFGRVRVPVALTDSELVELAEKLAGGCAAITAYRDGIAYPAQMLRARMEKFCVKHGVRPPEPARKTKTGKPAGVADGPAIARMACAVWWRRALRREQARELEAAAIDCEFVHKNAARYASDATVERRIHQRARNAAALESTLMRNTDTGDEYTLAELAALSVANPAIRRGELMTRISGFEAVARGLGHVAEFVTLTCPSRFHAMRKLQSGKVDKNPRFDGSSPRDAQRYLSGLWARLRAWYARRGLRFYGFRIAEPHHDGTPHWHLLLFMPEFMPSKTGAVRRTVPRFRAAFRRYALKDSGDESGARKHRAKFESIDWARGTAAGYVLKYVAKNIDGNGYAVHGDIEGGGEIYPSQRVEAWASTWGIRQFQQVGGPPVGVWRELRRQREEKPGAPEFFEAARAAADVGNWRRYVEVMGGPVVARADLPLRVAYSEPGELVYHATGEVVTGRVTRYGELCAPAVVGIRFAETVERLSGIVPMRELVESVVPSVRYRWEVVGFEGAKRPRTCVNNCTRGERGDGKMRGNGAGKIGFGAGRSGGGGKNHPGARRERLDGSGFELFAALGA